MTGSGRPYGGNGQQNSRSAASKPNLDDYVDVAQRVADFYSKFPDGVIRTVLQDSGLPYTTQTLPGLQGDEETFLVVVAEAKRDGDSRSDWFRASAWEPFPGRTPFTRKSELMNAETSAWGRVLAAMGFGGKKIASAEEVRNRSAEREQSEQHRRSPQEIAADARKATTTEQVRKLFLEAGKPPAGLGPLVDDWDGEEVPLGDLLRAAKTAVEMPKTGGAS